jgi:hypothetical protein
MVSYSKTISLIVGLSKLTNLSRSSMRRSSACASAAPMPTIKMGFKNVPYKQSSTWRAPSYFMPVSIGRTASMPPYGLWPCNMPSMFTTTHLEKMPFVLPTYLLVELYRAIVYATPMSGGSPSMSLTPNFNRVRNCLDGNLDLGEVCSSV